MVCVLLSVVYGVGGRGVTLRPLRPACSQLHTFAAKEFFAGMVLAGFAQRRDRSHAHEIPASTRKLACGVYPRYMDLYGGRMPNNRELMLIELVAQGL